MQILSVEQFCELPVGADFVMLRNSHAGGLIETNCRKFWKVNATQAQDAALRGPEFVEVESGQLVVRVAK